MEGRPKAKECTQAVVSNMCVHNAVIAREKNLIFIILIISAFVDVSPSEISACGNLREFFFQNYSRSLLHITFFRTFQGKVATVYS